METASDNQLGAFTLEGFCDYASIGRSRAYELLNAGELKARKSGGRTLMLKSDADAHLARLPEFKARGTR